MRRMIFPTLYFIFAGLGPAQAQQNAALTAADQTAINAVLQLAQKSEGSCALVDFDRTPAADDSIPMVPAGNLVARYEVRIRCESRSESYRVNVNQFIVNGFKINRADEPQLEVGGAGADSDGFNWAGSCEGPGGLKIEITPSDDDVRMVIHQGATLRYDASAASDFIDESANVVHFRGQDPARGTTLALSIVRSQGLEPQASVLSLNDQAPVGLSHCTLRLVDEP